MNILNHLLVSTLMLTVVYCNSEKPNSVEMIADIDRQNALFNGLSEVTGNVINDGIRDDSLAFLVLPLEASCPSCRKKTIDSIIKHKDKLENNHFIILSAKAGLKLIRSYFKDRMSDLPVMSGQLIIDSVNLADQFHLYKDNPVMYYSSGQKVYKKVSAVPATVKQDLHEFFSGQ